MRTNAKNLRRSALGLAIGVLLPISAAAELQTLGANQALFELSGVGTPESDALIGEARGLLQQSRDAGDRAVAAGSAADVLLRSASPVNRSAFAAAAADAARLAALAKSLQSRALDAA